MKILSTTEMREVDRLTAERGIPNLILMENAGHRVIEFLEKSFSPLTGQRIVVFCGKGNNGGDGLVVGRQLFTRIRPASLHVVVTAPEEMAGDAAENLKMLRASGCPVETEITPEMRAATLIVDGLLGTGIQGRARGRTLDFIREINTGFPLAEVVSIDIPSGMESDGGDSSGEFVRAAATVTFTAPKLAHVLQPNCDHIGKLEVAQIGSPADLWEHTQLELVEPQMFAHLLGPREPDSHKGKYGHVLVVAGSRGKTGAAAMTGIAVLRCGGGLSTVASSASAIASIAAFSPEVMTHALAETADGSIARDASLPLEKMTVLAVGPGIGTHPDTVELVRRVFAEAEIPAVVDADGLNALAGTDFRGGSALRVLTPHPGEMQRLAGGKGDRLQTARRFAAERHITLVLKGHRTIIAFPDGRAWINPTGSPALATGGTGDVLTGMIAGMLAQYPNEPELAVAAAVYLHGRSGQLGAEDIGERSFLATDIFSYLPEAMRECADLSDGV